MSGTSLFGRLSDWLSGRPKSRSSSSGEALQLLAQNSSDVIFRFGRDGRARYISPSVKRMYGYTPAEIYAMGGSATTNNFLHPADQAMVSAAVRRHFEGDLDEVKLEFRIINRAGETLWVQTNCSTVVDSGGLVTDIIFTMRDISEIKALEEQLQAQARTDGLTGLANRRAFDEALDKEWRRTIRESSELSLLLLDVDCFKVFNDVNGHQVGDDCLRTLACTMRECCARAGDLSARYGGEEFAVILPHTGQAEAKVIAEALRRSIEALQLPHPGGVGPVVTISIGAATAKATLGGTIKMPSGLLAAADQALYKAKANGRNRVEATLLLTQTSGRRAA